VLLLLLLLFVVLLLGATYYFSNQVLQIRTNSNEAILTNEVDAGRLKREQLDLLPKEEISMASDFGYRLNGWFIPSEEGVTGHTVVFAHGVTSSLLGMLKYTGMFRRRGFNVLLYDHRRHGLSGGRYTTYGFYEKNDLKSAVDWVYGRLGPDTSVGVFGESMGAATALLYAAMDDRPAFVIADCAYSDLTEQFAYRLKVEYGLPRFPLLTVTSLWCKLRAGFFFHEVSPIRHIDRVRAPILFVHGVEDDYVPNRNSHAMHKLRTGAKGLYLAPGAAHAESWTLNQEEYEREVDAFLRAHHLLPEAARA
jgi:fermentation-respiration switch protein FrsA (DUF1100 family)